MVAKRVLALRAEAEATASAAAAAVAATRGVLVVVGVEETATAGPWVVLRLVVGGIRVEGRWIDLWGVFGGRLLVGGSLARARCCGWRRRYILARVVSWGESSASEEGMIFEIMDKGPEGVWGCVEIVKGWHDCDMV